MRLNRVIRAYGEPSRREGYTPHANGRRRNWGLFIIVGASLIFWIMLAVLLWRAL